MFGGVPLHGYLARRTLAAINEWFWLLAILVLVPVGSRHGNFFCISFRRS